MSEKILFLDRDGTLIDEPEDKQIDSVAKLKLKPSVVPALLQLQQAGYRLVMVSNQNGIGTPTFPTESFTVPHQLLLDIFQSQGVVFSSILICPHMEADNCSCRKPKLGLVMDYLREGKIDFAQSYVIGDRETDLQLAENMGIKGMLYDDAVGWLRIARQLTEIPRSSCVHRVTKETDVCVTLNLDQQDDIVVNTGIAFFDHMLEQLAKHAGCSIQLQAMGDLHIDEHHTVEDVALTLGQAFRKALGDKLGIARYGFLLPMDDALSHIALDLSGRCYFVFEGQFNREIVGELPTELVPHFFRSFAESLGAALHIKMTGENTHHMVESLFKGVGQTLRQAIAREGNILPSTKGVL